MSSSKFTDAIRADVVGREAAGASLGDAARAAGVQPSTCKAWVTRGRREREGEYAVFVEALAEARAQHAERPGPVSDEEFRRRLEVAVRAGSVQATDGVLPTLALVDELHRHKSGELYGVLADGLGPGDGQLITISTAGDDEDSPLGRLRARAHALPGLVRDGAYRHVRTPDFAMHDWALDPDQDRDDLEVVKTANPASWQTVEELRKRKRW